MNMSKLKVIGEKIFVIFVLFMSTSALVPVLLNSEDASGQSEDSLTPMIFLGIYLILSLLIVINWKSFFYVAQKNLFIWVLVAITLASVFWSIAPDITQRRSILVLGTTCFGVYLAARYSQREQLELLGWTFGIIVILSFLFAIALPSYGIMSVQEGGAHAGSWRGILTHKNVLGRLMNVSSLVFFLLAISHSIYYRKYQWLPWVFYSLSFALILLSTSKTGLFVFVTLIIIFPLFRSLRNKYDVLIPMLITFTLIGGGFAIVFLDNLPVIASAVGRDLTLTGRTDIWIAMLDLIEKRPLFGYGFNAFWRGWESETSAYLWRTLEWECPYGHNGFMDLLAELGASGLGAFTLTYISAWIKGISWLRMSATVEGIWPLLYITFMFLYNLTEGTLLANNSIFWILYVSCIFSIALESEIMKNLNYSSKYIDEELSNKIS